MKSGINYKYLDQSFSLRWIAAILSIFNSFIYGQYNNKGKDTVYTLEPVVISARAENSIMNIPFAVDITDSVDIKNNIKGSSLNEFLNNVPGLFVSNRNNPSIGDRITMRGIGTRASFGVRGIKIIYDGIPLTFADGQSELTNIDFSSIGNVEVLHGPASSLYGNAAGGVINIRSEKPSSKTIMLNPSFTTGSFGFKNYNLKSSGTLNRFSYLISLNKLLNNGFRDHSSENSFSINSILSLNISDKVNLKTIINYFDSPYLLNPSSLSKADALNQPGSVRPYVVEQGSGEKTWEGNYGITLKSEFDNNLSNTTTIYFIKRHLLNPIPGTIINLNRNAGGFRTFFEKKFQRLSSDPVETDLNLSGGFDIEIQNDLRKEYLNNGLINTNIPAENILKDLQYGNSLLDQNENVIGAAPFFSAQLIFNKKLELQGGLRYDNYNFKVDDHLLGDGDNSGQRRMSSLSPMLGIIFLPEQYIKIYGNYSTSFQTPTANELSNNPSGAGGFNQSLEPEKIRSFEIGTWGIYNPYKINFEASIFLMQFNNMLISYQSQEPGSEETFYKNAGRAENTGAELKLIWNPANALNISASFTKMHFTFKDYITEFNNAAGEYEYKQLKGNFVPGVPQTFFMAGIRYSSPLDLWLILKVEWYDKYFVNDLNGPITGSNSPEENYINDGFLNSDLILGYYFKAENYGIDLSIGIDNIFDKRYNSSVVPNAAGDRFFEPSAGRNFYFKLGASL
jgi:iron complex outermembrane receptor protein